MRRWLGRDIAFHSQGQGDLGDRMHRAFREAMATGAERAVIVGTDCPEITADLVQRAFHLLDRNDVVLGPAADGGYYLIGMRRLVPELFSGITWGTERVRQQTLTAARRAGVSVGLLDLLSDVDRPEDLSVWERACAGQWSPRPVHRISVIIPTLNEEEHIAATLASAQTAGNAEILVVDGGSRDRTAEIARSQGATVLTSRPGRARQMNVGAAVATGDALLFLHADTRLPASFGDHVRSALMAPDALAGAFIMRADAASLALRLVELGVNWRSRVLRMPYGDQALFAWAHVFRRLGGFPEIPIMEDYELVRRLRRQGDVAVAPAAVVTSTRRWQRLGVLRTTLVNQAVTMAYHAGVSPSTIARWYRGEAPPG